MNRRALRRQNDLSGVSIDTEAGHCAEGALFHVCFDPRPTESGAIKAVGPYANQGYDVISTTTMMTHATLAIEEAMGGYVVWGEYHDNPEYEELKISVLKQQMGFYPNIAMRASLLTSARVDASILHREWEIEGAWLRHRSNGLSTTNRTDTLDLEILHPSDCRDQLHLLRSIAESSLGLADLTISERFEGWTQIPIKRTA